MTDVGYALLLALGYLWFPRVTIGVLLVRVGSEWTLIAGACAISFALDAAGGRIKRAALVAYHALTGRQLIVERVVEKIVEKEVEKIVYREVLVPTRVRDMTVAEAFSCLGCEIDDSRDAVLAGYKKMIQRVHPDHGGSNYLAALVNTARSQLVK